MSKARSWTSSPEIRELVRRAHKQGWSVERTRNGHLRFRPPTGKGQAIVGTTPSDHRTIRNIRAHLRRLGLREDRRS
jgi:predicted RNA binding protein YcfA (HicA-like mRNA interferase family)